MDNAWNIFHSDYTLTRQARMVPKVFLEGRSLFMFGYFFATDQLRDMEDDFNVLPIPKYDALAGNIMINPSYRFSSYSASKRKILEK